VLAILLAVLLAADAATGGDRSGAATAFGVVLSGAVALPLIVRARAPEAALAGTLALGTAAVLAAGAPLIIMIPAMFALYSIQERRRRKAEAELRRQEQELRRLDEERIRIARDVHDGVGQALAAINIQAGAAAAVAEADPAEVGAALKRIRETCRVAMSELRGTLEALRTPGAGADVPLTSGRLAEIAAVARAAGLHVEVRDELPASLEGPVASAAYRIVQEAVTNVIRHARAHSCRLEACCHDGRLELRVLDDGAGPAGTDPGHTGFGLTGMRERAAALGGTVTSGPEAHGWQVVAVLPLSPDPEEA
jgi:signal transduction histidine kinase